MRTLVLPALLALFGLFATSVSALDARQMRLYEQIVDFGIAKPVAEWIAEEAVKARVRTIRIGNTRGSYGVAESGGKITIQNSAGGRSVRNLTHEIAHIGAGLGGHDCRWIKYLTAMAVRYEALFGRDQAWGTHSLESYYPRYRLGRCRS